MLLLSSQPPGGGGGGGWEVWATTHSQAKLGSSDLWPSPGVLRLGSQEIGDSAGPLEVALGVDEQNSQPSTPDPWNSNSLIYRFLFNIE